MTRIFAALCFALLAFSAAPAIASPEASAKIAVRAPAKEELKTPTRESLVAFFEQQMKSDPQVVKFEKTAEGEYVFETKFFPYAGKLLLLNAVVTKYDDQYYENLYRGIIELDLPDANDDFFKKYARSYAAWTSELNYYFNMKKGTWFAGSAWNDNLADFDKYAVDKTATAQGPTPGFWAVYGKNLLPIGIFVLVISVVLIFAKSQNKRVWDNHAKALVEQQRGLKMVEESLGHQREHTRLLQEILATLKK